MKYCPVLVLGLFFTTIVCAQHADMQMKRNEKPATTTAGMGSQHHPVSTTNPEAQKFFDQGLSFVYAFNHDEAIRSFKRAELDPQMAMAHWGLALALGPTFDAKGRTADAGREYALLVEAENKVSADASFGLNNARTVLKIAENVLGARIDRMTKRDTQSAIELLRKTVEIEDSLAYDEPPAWFLPTRQLLGGALLVPAPTADRSNLNYHAFSARSFR